MKNIVATREDRCVGCNRCIRACPIETANITYLDNSQDIKVKVDPAECIACGSCLKVCAHEARYFEDDTERFFNDLKAGVPVTVIAAPSVRINFPNWKRLIRFFRDRGVQRVYDVSLGADLCIWASVRYMEKEKPAALISRPCPVIVSYCEIHRPELLPRLSPVLSPMGCLAVYLREYAGVTGPIAALSPCIAKGNEFEKPGGLDYNITFQKLMEYLAAEKSEFPDGESDFDEEQETLGSVFSRPGGFRENMEFFMGKMLAAQNGGNGRIDQSEGKEVFGDLDSYAETMEDLLPGIFDVLNCSRGCNLGPGSVADENIFRIQTVMDAAKKAALEKDRDDYYSKLYRRYDEQFELSRFLSPITAGVHKKRTVSEEDIQRAFIQLDKDTFSKQNFNCGACGSESCRDMARKIALELNISMNCMVKVRDEARQFQQRNVDLYRKNAEYIELVHEIGSTLLAVNDENFPRVMGNALEAICSVLGGSGAHVWKSVQERGELNLKILYGYNTDGCVQDVGAMGAAIRPWWLEELSRGRSVGKNRAVMSPEEKQIFLPRGINSVLVVPILIKEQFWGCISVGSNVERSFEEEDVSAITAGGFLIVSSIMERELTERLVEAKEDALAGTRAKSDFLSRMSHEIRTPMNAIIGMTRIAENTDDTAKLKYCLSTISGSSAHLLGLINDILDMSKIEAGKFDLDSVPFNLEKMLIKICNIINERTDQKNQRLGVIIDSGLPMNYQGDELRLSQVITNLLSNAVKFTPEGGKITVRVENAGDDNQKIRLRFFVADTGIGLTGEQIKRLFTPFQQAAKNVTQRFGGTGLGLAISKSIVEKMNGRIWVESKPGEGSSFIFEVELIRDTESKSANQEEISRLCALVAGRDTEIRDQTAGILRRFGMEADTASDEDAAAAMLSGRQYDAVFLDYHAADGLALLERLAALTEPRRLVLICSFLAWSKIEKDAGKTGIRFFVGKPIFASNLLDVINQVRGKVAVKAQPGESEHPDFTGLKLLLAEDIDINREIFKAILEDTHIDITIAENGTEAVNRFQEAPGKFDIIIMDVQMPEMDGLEATRAIRAMKTKEASSIPIVAMTANVFREDIERCLAAGMNDHLKKPIEEKALIEKILFYTKR